MVKQNKSDELQFNTVKTTIFCRTNVNIYIEQIGNSHIIVAQGKGYKKTVAIPRDGFFFIIALLLVRTKL